jgi:Zn-dependent protease
MNPTFTIGRIAGVRISINWSWLIVFALIVWSLEAAVFPAQNPGLSKGTYVAMAIVAAFLFFSSLLLHELGHAVQARREQMEIEDITLWLFGGVARFRGMFETAGAEFRIAIAGPLVSLALGLGFALIAGFTHFWQPIDGVAAWLGYINLLLLAFNLLPALPLDGGRVLRSALWQARGDFAWATAVAADVGRGIGFLMIGGGTFLFVSQGAFSGAWFVFIGWFLLGAASAEARHVAARQALDGLLVRDLMIHRPVTARVGETLGEFMDETAGVTRHTVYPVLAGDAVVGLLPLSSVAATPRREWDLRLVADSMLPLTEVPVVREDESAFDVLAGLSGGRIHRALVMDNGHLLGFISISDIARFMGAGRPARPGPRQ